jgi:hypothetical protein
LSRWRNSLPGNNRPVRAVTFAIDGADANESPGTEETAFVEADLLIRIRASA